MSKDVLMVRVGLDLKVCLLHDEVVRMLCNVLAPQLFPSIFGSSLREIQNALQYDTALCNRRLRLGCPIHIQCHIWVCKVRVPNRSHAIWVCKVRVPDSS